MFTVTVICNLSWSVGVVVDKVRNSVLKFINSLQGDIQYLYEHILSGVMVDHVTHRL